MPRDREDGYDHEFFPLVCGYDEAARLVGFSRRKLERLVAANQFPHIRHGGQVLFPYDAIVDWLTSQVQGASPEYARMVRERVEQAKAAL